MAGREMMSRFLIRSRPIVRSVAAVPSTAAAVTATAVRASVSAVRSAVRCSLSTATATAKPAAAAVVAPVSFVDRLKRLEAAAVAGGGAERIAAQHKKGKLTARERLDLLLDRDSFVEYD